MAICATSAALLTTARTMAQDRHLTPDQVEGELPSDVLALLDPGVENSPMRASLNRKIEFGSATYYVIVQVQDGEEGEGEPVVIKKPASGQPVILEDFIGLPQVPVAVGFDDQAEVDVSLFALPENETVVDRPPVPPQVAATEQLDGKVLNRAVGSLNNLDSSTARGTNRGRLACAWAVNQIVQRALGRPILSGPAGLATSNLIKVLRAKHVRITDPVPGCIVISPTVYVPRANIGHVGVVGDGGKIYSNSSNKANWVNNFTTASWKKYYGERKGLRVEYYRLDEIYFP